MQVYLFLEWMGPTSFRLQCVINQLTGALKYDWWHFALWITSGFQTVDNFLKVLELIFYLSNICYLESYIAITAM